MTNMFRHAQVRWLALGSVLILGLLAFPRAADAQKVLRWKFTPGQQLQQSMVQDMSLDMNVGGTAVKMTVAQTVDTLWNIKEVSADGTADMVQTIKRVRMSLKGGPMPMDIDTDADKQPEGVAGQLATAMAAMVGAEFQMKMNAAGEVLDVTVPEQMTEALKAVPGGEQLASTFSGDGLKNLIVQGTPSFPKEPVQKGESWSREFSTKMPPAGTVSVSSTYTYAGEEEGNPPLDKLTVDMNQSIEAGEGAEFSIAIEDQETDGSIYFDNTAGLMVRSDIKQSMTMKISVGDRTMEQKIAQNIKVTFSPVK